MNHEFEDPAFDEPAFEGNTPTTTELPAAWYLGMAKLRQAIGRSPDQPEAHGDELATIYSRWGAEEALVVDNLESLNQAVDGWESALLQSIALNTQWTELLTRLATDADAETTATELSDLHATISAVARKLIQWNRVLVTLREPGASGLTSR